MLGEWAYRNMEAEVALNDVNPDYLMWNIRGKVDTGALPQRRIVVRFHFADLKQGKDTYWLIARPGVAVDLCMSDPGFDVDLFVEAESDAMASFWMGYTSLQSEMACNRIRLLGDSRLAKTVDNWLVRSSYAAVT